MIRMINRALVLMLCASLTQAIAAEALLEDFASMRKNGVGDNLWFAYLGASPNQTSSIENGTFKVSANSSSAGVYFDFLPIQSNGYSFPQGFMRSWIKSGTWDPNTNRLTFACKFSKNVTRRSDGGTIGSVVTYVKNHDHPDNAWQGAHYYHLFDPNIYADQWMYFELNRAPQHQVGSSGDISWPEDPTFSGPSKLGNGVHYYDGLTLFYLEFNDYSGFGGVTSWCDDFKVNTVANEPDSYVATITSTYTGSRYEVAWQGPKNQSVSYEVRYSNTSMKSAGFETGSNGGTVSNPGNAYQGTIWTSGPMAKAPVLYVAIRPVGQSNFTEISIPPTSSGTISSCDLTGDGIVTAADVDAAKNAALGQTACKADLDQNGRCDVVDVQRVINASLGGACRLGP
jgi:hypothetical protein